MGVVHPDWVSWQARPALLRTLDCFIRVYRSFTNYITGASIWESPGPGRPALGHATGL